MNTTIYAGMSGEDYNKRFKELFDAEDEEKDGYLTLE